MAVTPQTNLFLLKSPLQINNKNQLTFPNETAQHNYFLTLPKLEVDNISYQRKDNTIRYPAHMDTLLEYNYCMYQNENYGNKWFYAFITGMTYVNDNCTHIQIATDCFQTWQFDLTYLTSFVEREMINTADDIAGVNLLPEGLENGEPIINSSFSSNLFVPVPVIAYSGDNIPTGMDTQGQLITTPINQGAYRINGIESSIAYILCPYPNNEQIPNPFETVMELLQNENYSEYIVTCFTIPLFCVENLLNDDNKLIINNANTYILQRKSNIRNTRYTQIAQNMNIGNRPTSLNGYTPRNKKLLTYPYCYLGCNPLNGSSKIYRFEDFTNGNASFNVISEVNPNPTICFIPQNYRGETNNSVADIVTMNGYPTLSSRSDTFNSWLAQNGNILSLQMSQEQYNYEINQLQTGLNYASNLGQDISSLNIAGSISNSINTGLQMGANDVNHEYYIKNQMAQIEKQKLIPDKTNLSGSNATLLGYNLLNQNIFSIYTIKRQFAERIDKFFDLYGYQTNLIKIPHTNNRPNWNYVKTTGINIKANIPQTDLQVIKDLFNNGITLWHNPATFGDYSQNNR